MQLSTRGSELIISFDVSCIWGESAGDVLCALRVTTAQPDPYNNTVRRQQALDDQAEVLSQ
jgi:hypothetical protein